MILKSTIIMIFSFCISFLGFSEAAKSIEISKKGYHIEIDQNNRPFLVKDQIAFKQSLKSKLINSLKSKTNEPFKSIPTISKWDFNEKLSYHRIVNFPIQETNLNNTNPYPQGYGTSAFFGMGQQNGFFGGNMIVIILLLLILFIIGMAYIIWLINPK